MAITTQDELYRTFLMISGQQEVAIGNTKAMLTEVIAELQSEKASTPTSISASKTQSATPTTTQSGGDMAGSVASTILKSGFGLAPLISGIVSLFSGEPDTPAALVKYAMPAALNFQAAESNSRLTSVDYNQTGTARSYMATGGEPANVTQSGAAPQITVNVQAMDSQSFLDHSSEIAQAVRAAMLNSNAINDVVNNL